MNSTNNKFEIYAQGNLLLIYWRIEELSVKVFTLELNNAIVEKPYHGIVLDSENECLIAVPVNGIANLNKVIIKILDEDGNELVIANKSVKPLIDTFDINAFSLASKHRLWKGLLYRLYQTFPTFPEQTLYEIAAGIASKDAVCIRVSPTREHGKLRSSLEGQSEGDLADSLSKFYIRIPTHLTSPPEQYMAEMKVYSSANIEFISKVNVLVGAGWLHCVVDEQGVFSGQNSVGLIIIGEKAIFPFKVMDVSESTADTVMAEIGHAEHQSKIQQYLSLHFELANNLVNPVSLATQSLTTIAIRARRKDMELLYGQQCKLLICRIADETIKFNLPANIVPVYLYYCGTQIYLSSLLSHETEDEYIKLDYAPNEVLYIIYDNDEVKSYLDAFKHWWLKSSAQDYPEIWRLPRNLSQDRLSIALLRLLLTKIDKNRKSYALAYVECQKACNELREMHEYTVGSLRSLREYVSKVKMPSASLNLSFTKTSDTIAPPANQKFFEIKQFIPLSSAGIAAVCLYVASVPQNAAGELSVRLYTLEDDAVLGRWLIPYDKLSVGENLLELPTPDYYAQRSVEVHVSWKNKFPNQAPRLYLAERYIHPELWLQNKEKLHPERTLALSLYTTLPGSRIAASPYYISQKSSEHLSCYVSPERLARTKLITPVEGGNEKVLALTDNNHTIRISPTSKRTVRAVIAGACPANIRRLTAVVKVDAPPEFDMSYSLTLVPAGKSFKDNILAQSEWTWIRAGEVTTINLLLSQATSTACDLYIANRVARSELIGLMTAFWLGFSLAREECTDALIDPQILGTKVSLAASKNSPPLPQGEVSPEQNRRGTVRGTK